MHKLLYREKRKKKQITSSVLRCPTYDLALNENKEEPWLNFGRCLNGACLQKLFEISFNISLITLGAIIAVFLGFQQTFFEDMAKYSYPSVLRSK